MVGYVIADVELESLKMFGLTNSVVCKARNILFTVPIAAVLLVGGSRVRTVMAAQNSILPDQAPASAEDQKREEQKLKKGEAEAKRMLLLMDRDQSGKVSKQEYMRFMEAEFERLDKNKDGELDVKELTQVRYVHHSGIRR